MKKKVLIILTIILFCLAIVIMISFISNHKEVKNTIEGSPIIEVASTIIMDINPSIKIDLDKDSNVINVTALNSDANDIVSSDLKGKSIENVFEVITDRLIDKGYVNNETTILINVDGLIDKAKVENGLKDALSSNDVDVDIIYQEVTESAKELAEKYNISIVKASYLEEIVANDENVNYEDLKDKSIKQITEITEKKEDEQLSNNAEYSHKVTYNSCTPPSDLKDSAWCSFNSSRPQYCEYYYEKMIADGSAQTIALNKLGISPNEVRGIEGIGMEYAGASYCMAYKEEIITSSGVYTAILDSVTGEVISSSVNSLPSFVMTKDEALQKGLSYYGLNESDCRNCWVVEGTDGNPSGGWYYRFQVNMDMQSGNSYSIDYNAVTGEIMSTRQW